MPTQRQLTVAEYIQIVDYYAAAVLDEVTARGDEDTADTAAYETRQPRDLIVGLTQGDEYQITADFVDAVGEVVAKFEAISDLAALFSRFNSAIRSHLSPTDINSWLSADGSRVSYLWRRAGDQGILPTNVFPPVTTLGLFDVTGADTGTLTDSAQINTNLHGGAAVEIEVTAGGPTAAETVVDLSVEYEDGSTGTESATIPAATADAETIAVGLGTEKIVDLTGITITGGTNGDQFRVQTIEDRTIS